MDSSTKVAIGLGSNLSDRVEFLNLSISEIKTKLEGVKCSQFYETEPWGVKDQPRFLNAVLIGYWRGSPSELFHFLKSVEAKLGRKRRERFGPREIDLDLIAFGEQVYRDTRISVPHYAMAERDFVLQPFSEVWPEWRHPQLGLTVAELLARLPENGSGHQSADKLQPPKGGCQ